MLSIRKYFRSGVSITDAIENIEKHLEEYKTLLSSKTCTDETFSNIADDLAQLVFLLYGDTEKQPRATKRPKFVIAFTKTESNFLLLLGFVDCPGNSARFRLLLFQTGTRVCTK